MATLLPCISPSSKLPGLVKKWNKITPLEKQLTVRVARPTPFLPVSTTSLTPAPFLTPPPRRPKTSSQNYSRHPANFLSIPSSNNFNRYLSKDPSPSLSKNSVNYRLPHVSTFSRKSQLQSHRLLFESRLQLLDLPHNCSA